ncbi:MAG: hypothetical protein KKE30_05645 [Gammaproteobacteria bacterium]|nr:hypothetical protein [Gammaproteobacteria bacterium]MBU1554486.1 hypothetical protein [Gammaproteobacteria bacterium]MBU2070686.1 hypothetical protein [Gammaproteobacteria bacterium]MBU2184220.1 hypothetical protein [Gammaproteobacteria bacterium]MBU2206081.1 hypothetical protein [Gammaproteobacteria bacterium]
MLAANPAMQIHCLRPGNEQSPLLIIDNFIAEPEQLLADAGQQRFVANSPYYPGVRAPAPQTYQHVLLHSLTPLLREVFALPAGALSFSVCHYSLVTTPPQQLKLLQRIPHFDTTERHALAAVHYLFHGNQGGTAFYRHRQTGFETIDDSRAPAYFAALEGENDGPNIPGPDAGYINGDTPLFTQITEAEGVFNRLIIYRRHALHSGVIPHNANLSANPATGRLTISSFIDLQP